MTERIKTKYALTNLLMDQMELMMSIVKHKHRNNINEGENPKYRDLIEQALQLGYEEGIKKNTST